MLVQKTRKLSGISEGGDHDHLAQLQSHSSGLASEVSQVVFVAFANFFDHAMHAQAFEKACDLTSGLLAKFCTELIRACC